MIIRDQRQLSSLTPERAERQRERQRDREIERETDIDRYIQREREEERMMTNLIVIIRDQNIAVLAPVKLSTGRPVKAGLELGHSPVIDELTPGLDHKLWSYFRFRFIRLLLLALLL